MMALGDVAAKLGLPCFPCGDNKRPITETGFKAASLDQIAIVEMFSRQGAELIGVPTGAASGLVVIDVDIREDRSGMDWLNANHDALPETRTHKTRTGGLHLVFQAPEGIEIRNSAGRIAPGIDVRGEGGYVIWPPSPGYQVADQSPPAEMPQWLIRACLRPEPQPQPAAARPASSRQEGGTRYGLAALERECNAIAGAHFGQQEHTLNAAALKIGALVAGGELDESIALADLISTARGMASQSGREPWKPADVDAKVRRAFSDGMTRPREAPPRQANGYESLRYDHTQDPAYWASFEADLRTALDGDTETSQETRQEAPNVSHGLPLIYYLDIQPRLETFDFVEGLLGEGSSVVLYGESNSGKTFFATDLALHVASGQPWRGRAVEQGGVVYAALEGSAGFSNRITAWREANDDRNIPFAAIPAALNLLNPDADTPRLIGAVKEAAAQFWVPVKLVVIDTLSRAMAGGNENASEDMGALVKNMDLIRAETCACVLFVHHAGKDAAKGARGHSILRGAIDTEVEVSSTEGSKVRTAKVVKQREMETEGAFDFELAQVELGTNHRGKPVTSCTVFHLGTQPGDVGRDADGSPTGHAKTAHRLLTDLCAECAEPHRDSFNNPSVPENWWRERFYERAMPGAERKTREKTFRRAADTLQQTSRIALNRGRVWVVK